MKFHYFTLKYPTCGQIDFSRHEISLMRELKKIRDDYVHPKVLKGTWEETEPGTLESKLNCKDHYPVTKLTRKSVVWGRNDAIIIFKAATLFFDYFFIDVCKFDHNKVGELLFSSEHPDDQEYPSHYTFDGLFELKDLCTEAKFRALFLNINS